MSLNKNSTHCVMPRSWSLATHVKEVDQSGRVFCSYSKSISKIRQTRLFSHFLKMFKLRLMFPGSMPCRCLSWSPITDPLCSWIIWHEYSTEPASCASHRSHRPIADPQGVAAEKFSLKWESTQLGETLNAKLGIVFNSARKKYLR